MRERPHTVLMRGGPKAESSIIVLAEEIRLLGEVMAAALEYDVHLSDEEVARALGLKGEAPVGVA